MTKRMLIDSTHAEETRVVVLDGNRLEDFDVETSTKKQLKGNIYLAKIVRVEPSLQAAFVEYGNGRHGFLAFGEIHPDYYQIPVADRKRLLEMQAAEARAEEDDEDEPKPAPRRRDDGREGGRDRGRDRDRDGRHQDRPAAEAEIVAAQPQAAADADAAEADTNHDDTPPPPHANFTSPDQSVTGGQAEDAPTPDQSTAGEVEATASETESPPIGEPPAAEPSGVETPVDEPTPGHDPEGDPTAGIVPTEEPGEHPAAGDDIPANEPPTRAQPALIPSEVKFGELEFGAFDPEPAPPQSLDSEDEAAEDALDLPAPETIGGESDVFEGNGAEEARARRSSRMLRSYRIQEVIRRRQIMLIQVVKEERGTKGAALTTYISLAGRFCVLMPNSPRGGGISRKITSAADRRRLKEITAELEIPQGMGLIVRTAGAARPKPEIKRDCEYLMRLWDDIRDHTMRSTAPALIYEEASLIKRSIRDGYSRDIDEVLVDGEEGWRAAHDFMRMLMPAHAKKVILWKDGGQPLFSKHGVEAQLEAMLSPTVQLKSGGYVVINQTEALVAIDVNSGRATRERGIEETALKTNLEAVDEIARQLRLRDLAGLIVLDLIDMESKRNNAAVERRLKDALKNDRARIQVGFISHFGLLEMSRQRLRPSLTETSFMPCPHCVGTGLVRSIESSAIHVLRALEDEGAKDKASLIMVHAANAVIMYILNNKRERLAAIEARYSFKVHFSADDSLVPPEIRIDRVKPQIPEAERFVAAPVAPAAPSFATGAEDDEDVEDTWLPAAEDDEDDTAAERPQARADRRPERRPEAARSETRSDTRSETRSEARSDTRSEQPREESRGERGPETAASSEEGQRRRRRRRRGGRREAGDDTPMPEGAPQPGATDEESASIQAEFFPEGAEPLAGSDPVATAMDPDAEAAAEPQSAEPQPAGPQLAGQQLAGQPGLDAVELDENGMPKARRRGRRGGRRRRRDGSEAPAGEETTGEETAGEEGSGARPSGAEAGPVGETVQSFAPAARQQEEPRREERNREEARPTPPFYAPQPYSGPTPADPFGGQETYDIFDMIDRAAEESEARPKAAQPRTELEIPEPPQPPAEPKKGWWRRG